MKQNEYQQFLSQLGARFNHGLLQDFGEPEAEFQHADEGDFITSLDQYRLISVSGDDARTFLQGQFSNDIELVTAHNSQINSYSSPKGRLFAIFRMLHHQDQLYINIHADVAEAFLKRLRMFVLRSKVDIQECSAEQTSIGIGGQNAASILSKQFPTLPSQSGESLPYESLTVIRAPGSLPRFEVYGDYANIHLLWQSLDPQLKAVSPDVWQLHHINAGIPTIFPQTSEAFVAQMVNLDLLNAVNFKKGCYTGQEVIARMHYRGKTKRRMFHLQLETGQSLPAGATLYYLKDGDYRNFGEVVDSIHNGKHAETLAVLQLNHDSNNTVYLQTGEDDYTEIKSSLIELPYTLEID